MRQCLRQEHGFCGMCECCLRNKLRMRERCDSHKSYTARKPPRCNEGKGCLACWKKYTEHLEDVIDNME